MIVQKYPSIFLVISLEWIAGTRITRSKYLNIFKAFRLIVRVLVLPFYSFPIYQEAITSVIIVHQFLAGTSLHVYQLNMLKMVFNWHFL